MSRLRRSIRHTLAPAPLQDKRLVNRREPLARGYMVSRSAGLSIVQREGRPAIFGILDVRPKDFRHAPRLRKTASRPMWRVAVEDFRDLAQTGLANVRAQRIEKLIRPTPG